MHGRMSQVHYEKSEETEYQYLMHDCPSPFWAVRYHSLVVEKDCKEMVVRNDTWIMTDLFVLL
jgi:anthranilate/para-aminobenzoate synthase component II